MSSPRLQTLSAAVADSQRRIEQATARQDELTRDQDRLRENLQAVPPGSDLARRYLKALDASEDELARLSKRLESLRSDPERATAERLEFVRSATALRPAQALVPGGTMTCAGGRVASFGGMAGCGKA